MKKQALIALTLFSIPISACTQEDTTVDKEKEQAPVESANSTETEPSTHDQEQQTTENNSTSATKSPLTSVESDSTNNDTSSQENVIASVKEQIQDSLPPRLPKKLPVSSKEMHLSAAIDSESDMYRVIFFESKKVIPINSKELNDSEIAKPIAKIEVRKYETEQEAESEVGYISPEDIPTGNPINLGHSIKGYPEGGAGNKWLNWHEGRWYLQVHASNIEGNTDYLPLAKSMVDYLEENELPVPHKYGSVKADVEKKKAENNRISWQEETIVYTISNVKDPIDMLTIASNFDNTEK